METKERKDFGEDSPRGGVVGLDAADGIETGSPLMNANLAKLNVEIADLKTENAKLEAENAELKIKSGSGGSGDSGTESGHESEPESASGTEHESITGSEGEGDSSGSEGDDSSGGESDEDDSFISEDGLPGSGDSSFVPGTESPSKHDIFINNACGQISFFKNVLIIDGGIEDWFHGNDIEDIVNNNLGSCDWGVVDEIIHFDEPDGGWLREESEPESEPESGSEHGSNSGSEDDEDSSGGEGDDSSGGEDDEGDDSFISENGDSSGSGDSSFVPGTESEPESASGTEHESNTGSEDDEDSSGGEGDDSSVEVEQAYLPMSKLVRVLGEADGMKQHPIEQFLTGNGQALEKKVEALEADVAKLTTLCGGCGYYVDQTDCCPPQVCCDCERSFCGRHSRMDCWVKERTFWEEDIPNYDFPYDFGNTIAWLEHKYPNGVCYNCATAYLEEKYEDQVEYYPAKIQALVRGFLARKGWSGTEHESITARADYFIGRLNFSYHTEHPLYEDEVNRIMQEELANYEEEGLDGHSQENVYGYTQSVFLSLLDEGERCADRDVVFGSAADEAWYEDLYDDWVISGRCSATKYQELHGAVSKMQALARGYIARARIKRASGLDD